MKESLLDVTVHAKLDKFGKLMIFELRIKDDNGTDITDAFKLYAAMPDTDIARTDCIDVIIRKAK